MLPRPVRQRMPLPRQRQPDHQLHVVEGPVGPLMIEARPPRTMVCLAFTNLNGSTLLSSPMTRKGVQACRLRGSECPWKRNSASSIAAANPTRARTIVSGGDSASAIPTTKNAPPQYREDGKKPPLGGAHRPRFKHSRVLTSSQERNRADRFSQASSRRRPVSCRANRDAKGPLGRRIVAREFESPLPQLAASDLRGSACSRLPRRRVAATAPRHRGACEANEMRNLAAAKF